MVDDLQTLDYERKSPVTRPIRPLSDVYTASGLLVAVLFADSWLRFDYNEAGGLWVIELLLIVYGGTGAIVAVARGGLTSTDKLLVTLCGLLFVSGAYVSLLMPRVIHN